MTIQTTSLETSKLLKEARFRQDTQFSWAIKSSKTAWLVESRVDNRITHISSPHTDELLSELPCLINDKANGCRLNIDKVITRWQVRYGNYVEKRNKLLPEALASMWIWLHKEGLI